MRVIALLLLSSISAAAPVRVFYSPDGKVAILRAIMCREGETPQACLDRIGAKDCPRGAHGACLPYDDIDDQTLPARATRNKWRGDKRGGLRVDASIITKAERIEAAEKAIDLELAKPDPRQVEVIRLSRELEKAKKLPRD